MMTIENEVEKIRKLLKIFRGHLPLLKILRGERSPE